MTNTSSDAVLNIVVPMAGRGSRFAQAGYRDPKPLIPVDGRPMLQWVIDNVRPRSPHRFIFICLAGHLREYPEIQPTLARLCPGCEVVTVNEVTEGAACTVLLARHLINNSQPLMIANSDQYVDYNINAYLALLETPGADGLIMTFHSNHPKWSYCRMRPDGSVSGVIEKQVVSREATVGIYNYRRGADFVRAAEEMIARDLRVNGEFYVAPAYNLMIERGARIIVANIGDETGTMHGLGTPEDLRLFCDRKGIPFPMPEAP